MEALQGLTSADKVDGRGSVMIALNANRVRSWSATQVGARVLMKFMALKLDLPRD